MLRIGTIWYIFRSVYIFLITCKGLRYVLSPCLYFPKLLCFFFISGPWFNIKMSSYQYRKYHCGDKMVVKSSYLHNGISYTDKMTFLYWISHQFFAYHYSDRTWVSGHLKWLTTWLFVQQLINTNKKTSKLHVPCFCIIMTSSATKLTFWKFTLSIWYIKYILSTDVLYNPSVWQEDKWLPVSVKHF